MVRKDRSRKTDPSDLTDEQWAIVEPLLPPAKQRLRGGRPRTVDLREVLNTLLSLNRSGGQWDMLPHDVLPKSTVYDYFARWRNDGTWTKLVKALRERTRVAAGRAPTPSAACIDSQSLKTTERGGPERGDDGGKKLNGHTRHVWVDILLGHVTPYDFPRLITIFADQKDHTHTLEAGMAEHRAGWRIEVKARPEGTKGFTPLAKRWGIARTNAWHGRYRRDSKDYERSVESSTAMLQISHVHLMLNRLSPRDRPAFHYRQDAA
jgi:putative transposase